MSDLKIAITVENFEEVEQLFKRAQELTNELGKIYWKLSSMKTENIVEKEKSPAATDDNSLNY